MGLEGERSSRCRPAEWRPERSGRSRDACWGGGGTTAVSISSQSHGGRGMSATLPLLVPPSSPHSHRLPSRIQEQPLPLAG